MDTGPVNYKEEEEIQKADAHEDGWEEEDRVPNIELHRSARHVLSRTTEKRKILCNVMLTAIACMLHYTATQGISRLQSTINSCQGVGVLSLATFHISSVCSKLFSPFFPRRLDPKRMMSVVFLTVIPYLIAQLYPMFLTLIPTAILYGMGSELLSSAVYMYMFSEAWIYSQLSEVPIKVTIGNFFILFFLISNWCLLWSGAVPYVVLLLNNDGGSQGKMPKMHLCDCKFCPKYVDQIPTLKRPLEKNIGIIMYIFMGCSVLAFIISILFIKSLIKYQDQGLLGKHLKHRLFKYLSNIATFFKDFRHMLVLPLMLWFGMIRAFIIADLTQSFIACNHGIRMVGVTTIAAGVAKLVGTGLISIFARIRRDVLFGCLVTVNLTIFVCLLMLDEIGKSIQVLLVIVVVWNLLDSMWIIQLNKVLTNVFDRQKFSAMDANLYMQTWQNLGSAVMYCLSPFVCTREKTYLVLGIMVVSTVGYILHSIFIYIRSPNEQEETEAFRSVLPFQ